MSITIKTLPDCCWRYMSGVNNSYFSEIEFKKACVNAFNAHYLNNHYSSPGHVSGALIFCGAYGQYADAKTGNTTNKCDIENSIESICSFIESEDIGYICEIPNFSNKHQVSTIIPRIWMVDCNKFKNKLVVWAKEFKMTVTHI